MQLNGQNESYALLPLYNASEPKWDMGFSPCMEAGQRVCSTR